MPKTIFKIDQGENFGKWDDLTSRIMYFNSVPLFLSLIPDYKIIADYGGANGNLKEFIPNIITIDIDSSKNPDICEDILIHKGKYDLIIIRYVLHYLSDNEIKKLFNHIKSYHKGKLLIIQFTNENNDLIIKKNNSINELKYFRNYDHLISLLNPYKIENQIKIEYLVSKEFYKNRLKNNSAKEHLEQCVGLLLS